MPKNTFMIEKSKDTRKILTSSISGFEPKVTIVKDREDAILYEVADVSPEDYQTILDRLISRYNFG